MTQAYEQYGFHLVEERPLPELGGQGLLLAHQSGARLLAILNDDDNQTFGIGFRTPSDNSTGVAHILEHSVLNGSRKYRTKEPFMDLVKSSLATFLNAMTFSDKTIYPVSSRNEKDFTHLMDVYLDAVFNPAIYESKEIFLQEGWHYHLEKADDPLTYRGVVYNEMRGALSGADAQVQNAILTALYPDTVYGKESGGDPYEIPSLTYDDFLDFHRRYYHPSNAYIFLYGQVDLARRLKLIHEDYLSHYEPLDLDSSLAVQAPFATAKEVEVTYSAAPEDSKVNKDQLAYALIFGSRTSLRDLFLADLLTDALIDSQAGPIRQALREAGIGADVQSFSSDGLQIPFGIIAKDTDAARKDDFVQVVEEAFRKLAEEGPDKDLLLASLNKIEFAYRECQGFGTRGVVYYINAFESWLYDGSPFDALHYEAPLAALREDIEAGRLGEEIRSRILDNPHKVILTARPEAGKTDRRDAAVAEELAAYKASLTEAEVQALVEETHRLIARQNRADTPEERATLPVLSLDDIDASIPRVPTEKDQLPQGTLISNDIFTSGILYLNLYFHTDHIAADDLTDYALLTALLGSMDSAHYSYADLSTREYLLSGGLNITPAFYSDFNDPDKSYPRLVVSTRLLGTASLADALDLIEEELCATRLDDKARLHEVIKMLRLRTEAGLLRVGHQVASARAVSYLSDQSAYVERIAGLDLLFALQDLDDRFDEEGDALVARLQALYARLVDKRDVLIGLTGSAADIAAARGPVLAFIDRLPDKDLPPADFLPRATVKNEGLKSAAGVQYVARAARLGEAAGAYKGSWEVLTNLLTNEYLYNEVRAKGGAYGQGIRFSRKGYMSLYSYRDPNLEKTMDVYAALPDWLAKLEMSREDLAPFIIGTVDKFNPQRTPAGKGLLSLRLHISGQSYEDIEATQAEALAASPEALKAMAPALADAMARSVTCVIGSATAIDRARDYFDQVRNLEG